jgi:O-antigen/teichoic acid export membrane protein
MEINFLNILSTFLKLKTNQNVFWNLLGGLVSGFMIIFATPFYLKNLGFDGYGILSFWLLMQVMMGLLDMGMGATLIRKFANPSSDNFQIKFKQDLLRTIEFFYWGISIVLLLATIIFSDWIGSNFLNSKIYSYTQIVQIVKLIGLALAFQLPCGVYLSCLSGLQKHGKMNAVQIVGTICRHFFGILILNFKGDLILFFIVQIFISFFQTAISRSTIWNLIRRDSAPKPEFNLTILKSIWRFSIGMALTSLTAVLLANIDRLVLSRMVTTEELGKYSIAFAATGILQLGIQPFYRAFFPRYSELVSSGNSIQLEKEYFESNRIVAVFIITIGIIGFVFANELFSIWLQKTIDFELIRVFRVLIFSITLSGLMWLPAAFQQSHGWTKLHIIMISSAIIIGSPIMILLIPKIGILGATIVWFIHGVSEITLGLWLMHKRLLIGKLIPWIIDVIIPPFLIGILIVLISKIIYPVNFGMIKSLVWIFTTALIVLSANFYYTLIRKRFRN